LSKTKNIEELSFEDALLKLEETVHALEEGNLPLEESIKLYELGMELTRVCTDRLAKAKLKITEIQTSYSEEETPDTTDREIDTK
jgi:exodeoxyribonuclease VII small subunit|tara:strand:- start:101 stop:355 length:255 start_codon:yes stop_codon:yes gene_type:complete